MTIFLFDKYLIHHRHHFGFYRATAKHTHGIAVEILSVRPSVRLQNPCGVTKRKHLAKKVQL